ncbi:MAG: hypothetical protein GY869_03040 [Planctomycetes bacterium]|nr:hypothetical protein [Planctomycetota bacterium]
MVQKILGGHQWSSSCDGKYYSHYVKGQNHSGCATIRLYYSNQTTEQWEISFDDKNTVFATYHHKN